MKTIFLVGNKDDYFYSIEENCVQPFQWNTKMLVVKKICKLIHCALPLSCLNKALYNADKVVITDSIFSLSLFLSLKKIYNIDNIYLYYMNVIDANTIKYMQYINENNIYTFDKNDSIKYSIQYKHTPYSKNIHLDKSLIKYDTIFLGRDKGRSEEIEKIYNLLGLNNLRANFLVLDSDNNNYKIDKYIDYFSYIELVSESKSILEINMKNQTGCTLRFMESLFLSKKLITNNEEIVKDEYYISDNVFIIGTDNIDGLNDFLNKPIVKVKNLQKLEFDYWLQNFGLEDK